MEITGILQQKFEIKSGTSNGKDWKFQDVLINVKNGNYEDKVLIKTKGCDYALNSELKFSLNIKAREYNGKWYNEVSAWKIECVKEVKDEIPPIENSNNEPNDLPF